ncbi:hypothetical protein C5748_23020 [Phyllobacterium phragmitis]|uniref:Uncharacterized protein n=1 Tax=Phyllobacterium phragmitis TaxID=2670329 RepID=A0A2S9IKR2_9HYPH|nr:hypothetical protein C5748_23020 [Phyllobacterium phragmitis]
MASLIGCIAKMALLEAVSPFSSDKETERSRQIMFRPLLLISPTVIGPGLIQHSWHRSARAPLAEWLG